MVSTITLFEMTLDTALSASLGTISTLLLITLLVLKELASTLEDRWQAFGRFLNIAIVPLLITFFITVVIRIVDVLR
jgi:hypothetical protein